MKNLSKLAVLGFSISLLSACESTREQFDFSKKAPDEFAVVTRAPLEMPNNLDNLPAPRPGMQRPQENSPEEQAKQALFGERQTSDVEKLTSGESALLQKTGAASVDPNIRNNIDIETQEVIKENTSTFNRILGKAGKKVDAPANVVDPIKESERIITNKKEGKAITEGETPTIEE